VFVDGDVFFAGGFYFFEHFVLVGVVVMKCAGNRFGISFQFVSCDPGDSDFTVSCSRYIRSTSSVATMYISAI